VDSTYVCMGIPTEAQELKNPSKIRKEQSSEGIASRRMHDENSGRGARREGRQR
jgi:hypothetical protein